MCTRQVVGLVGVLRSPDGAKQIGVGDQATGGLREVRQDRELDRREVDLFAVGAMHAMGRVIDREIGRHGGAVLGALPGADPLCCAQARHQLLDPERLGDIVGRTGVERLDLVALGTSRREHDDRDVCPRPYSTDDVQTRHAGQAEIEEEHVGKAPPGEPECVLAVAGVVHRVAAHRQVERQRTAQRGVILHH